MPLARCRPKAAVIACLVTLIVGCGPSAPEPHDPSLAGVVSSRDFLAPRTIRVVLTSGGSVDIDLATAKNLNPNLEEPDPGELLVYGVEAERPWFASAPPSIDGGFELRSPLRTVADRSILFESGLRLPIADDYSESLTGPMEAGAPVTYLLNEEGEVTRRQ